MQIEVVWLYFALLASLLAVVRLPVFRTLDADQKPARYPALDGLRGFLAFSVFVFHCIISRGYAERGTWEEPVSSFYGLLGALSVSLFFMITGFLFWTKLLSVRGAMRWRQFYVQRVMRIAPMYLFAVLVMIAVVFLKTGFELRQPLATLILSILQWLALGIGNLQPDINGHSAARVLAGVTWTISYEWVFYASLLATAYFSRGRAHLAFVLCTLALCVAGKVLLDSAVLGFSALFLSGMLVASLLHEGFRLPASGTVGSGLALSSLVLIFLSAFMFRDGITGYGTPALFALLLFFYLVCSGATLFGLLTTRAALRLGAVSYSVYLLQGLVLTTVFWSSSVREFALAAVANFWLVGWVAAAILLLSATLTYVLIERPGIRLGHRLTARRALQIPGAEARPSPTPARLIETL